VTIYSIANLKELTQQLQSIPGPPRQKGRANPLPVEAHPETPFIFTFLSFCFLAYFPYFGKIK
jgi:hypothetical protein